MPKGAATKAGGNGDFGNKNAVKSSGSAGTRAGGKTPKTSKSKKY